MPYNHDVEDTTDPELTTPAASPLAELWCPLNRVTKAEDDPNVRIIYGLVSDTHTDMDKQRCDGEWLRSGLTKWFNDWGNIRAMHQPIAAGKAVSLVEEAPNEWYLTSRIVDEDTVKKIDEGVYKGYSIHVGWPKLKRDPTGEAPLGLICGGDIIETSVVDRPSRSAAKIALVKAIGLQTEEDPDQAAFQTAWEAGDFDGAMSIVKAAKTKSDSQLAPAPTGYSDLDTGVPSGTLPDTDSGTLHGDGERRGPVQGSGNNPTDAPDPMKKVADGDGTCQTCLCSDCDASDPACTCCDDCTLQNLEKAVDGNGRKSPPKGYPKNKSQYAGPASFSFPVDSKARTRSAMAYYNAGKGKSNHSESEWASIGSKIAAAANKFFGGGYSLQDGKVTQAESKKIADVRESLHKHLQSLQKDVSPELVSVSLTLSSDEMEDSQVALVAAEMVRTLMQRELSEADPDESMQSSLSQLAAIYDSLMGIARDEYQEAFEYQAAASIAQMLIPNAGVEKMGAALSGKNAGLIASAHNALAMCAGGTDCDNYMKMAGAGGAAPEEVTKMADADKNTLPEDEENPKMEETNETPGAPETPSTPSSSDPETPDITELIKSVKADFTSQLEALSTSWATEREALNTELEELRNRAANDGPLVTAVTKAIGSNSKSRLLEQKREELTKAWDGAMHRTDTTLRSDDFRRAALLKKEIAALEAE